MMPASVNVSGQALQDLLQGMASDVPAVTVDGISMDSRQVQGGDLFLACSGVMAHGLDYVRQVIDDGAVAICWEPDDHWTVEKVAALGLAVPLCAVAGLSDRVATIAARFYGQPSEKLTVMAVTGTNGKSSVCTLLGQALEGHQACGIIGTTGYGLSGNLSPASHTTPNPVRLQSLMSDFLAQGAQCVAMEASSHGLHQNRLDQVQVDMGLFTNLSRDHLDYHEDMASYGAAKQLLFERPELRMAVINADDDFGQQLLKVPGAGVKVLGCTLNEAHKNLSDHMIVGHNLAFEPDGLRMQVSTPAGEGELACPLLGRFNAENILLVLGALLSLDMPLNQALAAIADVRGVPGRMECFRAPGQPLVVVDYAHTPDALGQALQALHDHKAGQVWCVFGCGGDRDRGKRPQMAAAAEQHADALVLTNDNPRHEDPQQILDDIRAGLQQPQAVESILDRAAAIRFAIEQAGANDIVLVAGKGHETVQQIGDLNIPYCDRQIVEGILSQAAADAGGPR